MWYKKYDTEIKKRQFLETKIERMEARYKILERETEKMSSKDNRTLDGSINFDMTSSNIRSNEKSNAGGSLNPTVNGSLVVSKILSESRKSHCPLCGDNLHPIYDTLDTKEEDNKHLRYDFNPSRLTPFKRHDLQNGETRAQIDQEQRLS